MWTLGPLGFTAPWLLVALIVLPVLWLILRAVPPAPIRRRFPGVALLLGLTDDESQTDRTPWWLLLLRILAVAAVIVAFAGPLLNPRTETPGSGPLLILADGSWASARDWDRRLDRLDAALTEAARDGRPVALIVLSDLPGTPPVFQPPEALEPRLTGLEPQPWGPDYAGALTLIDGIEGGFDTFWLSDGLGSEGRDALAEALDARGAVTAFESPRPVYALRPMRFEDGAIRIAATRSPAAGETVLRVHLAGLDPAGNERILSTVSLLFTGAETEAEAMVDLPPELRNRITRAEIEGVRSAGAVTLADDALRRREVALIAGGSGAEGLTLLDPLHYLTQALSPTADLIEGTLSDLLLANPDALILADVATLSPGEAEDLLAWVEEGGLLVRFAGPRLAASDISRIDEDPLLPVRLRAGGRSIGGAMSWGEPKSLAPFDEDSPFAGLPIPDDVEVTAQVMAQPDPSLSGRVIAQLADGTPLVTRKTAGTGQIVLFHVTANAEWSTLPLSGLFVQMLERLAVSTRPAVPEAAEMDGTVWQVEEVLDAFGRVEEAGTLPGVPGEALIEARLGPEMPPGLYAGEDRRLARNIIGAETALSPVVWPATIAVEGLAAARELPLKGWLLAWALGLLLIDIVASLWLSGKLRGPRAGAGATAALAALLAFAAPEAPLAQTVITEEGGSASDTLALVATSEVVLAYVLTGDAEVDRISEAGLTGLSQTLFLRTSIEPAPPIGVDLERDELSFFPILYWPVTADQGIPSREAYEKLNRYLRSGGMIVFDTRDSDIARFGSSSPEGRKLQALARPLDIPPLEPVPEDHVLTRTFYLLQDFPGRHQSRDVWVEAAPPGAELAEGMPFRNLNDGVTPVVVGGNDWASAWAVGPTGQPMFPIGRGMAGERQRELALRFGVNLVMHVLTGNYKSDQVHVPELLERLGQ